MDNEAVAPFLLEVTRIMKCAIIFHDCIQLLKYTFVQFPT